jgi:hypothetical protein
MYNAIAFFLRCIVPEIVTCKYSSSENSTGEAVFCCEYKEGFNLENIASKLIQPQAYPNEPNEPAHQAVCDVEGIDFSSLESDLMQDPSSPSDGNTAEVVSTNPSSKKPRGLFFSQSSTTHESKSESESISEDSEDTELQDLEAMIQSSESDEDDDMSDDSTPQP